MNAAPWLKWYWSDWRSDPCLRMCSLAARGLWAEMLAVMQEAVPYGHLLIAGRSPSSAQLAALAGAPTEQIPDLLAELESSGVFSRTKEGVVYSRRMVRDERKAREARKNGLKGGNPTLRNQSEISASDNPPDKGGLKTHMPEARGQKEDEHAFEPPRAHRRPERDELFECFKARYPKRDGTQDWPKARETFARLLKAGVDPEGIIGGAQRYAADCRRREVEGTQYVKQARSWLNGRLWEEYSQAAEPAEDIPAWSLLIGSFQRTGNWPGRLGPPPDASGCRAPSEFLAEFGYGPDGTSSAHQPVPQGGATHGRAS